MTTLADRVAIGMTSQRAADLRELNERIAITEALLSSLRQARQQLMGGIDGHDTPVELSTMSFTGEPIEPLAELRGLNGRLDQFQREWEEQDRRLDDEFDQRLAQDETEPRKEFSDVY